MTILLIIFILILGSFPAFIVYNNLDCQHNSKFKIWTITVFVWILSGGLFFVFIYGQSEYENSLWNNGKCSVCQGNWVFTNASHGKYDVFYYYKCDNCGRVIELTTNYR